MLARGHVSVCVRACVRALVIESIDFSVSVFMFARGFLSAEVNKHSVVR